jgi:hypothetical protein
VRASGDGDVVVPVNHPAAACLELDPDLELDLDQVPRPVSAAIDLHNACDQPVELGSVALRAPTEAFVVSHPPDVVGAGEDAWIDVRFLAGDDGLYEEVLLIEVTEPGMEDRFAVTIIARRDDG